METRICLQVFPLVTIRVEVINGYKKYILGGIASDRFGEILNFDDHLFHNRSYVITTENECLERVRNNESDLTSQLSFHGEETDTRVLVPVPSISMKTSMLSGYDLLKISSKDQATALSNFSRFEVPVFLYLVALIVSLVLSIALSVFVSSYRFDLVRMMILRPRRHLHRLRVFWKTSFIQASKPSLISQITRKTVNKIVPVFSGSSDDFKWIGFLFALLSLFMIGCYYGVFSTSSIVPEKRHTIESYEQLIDDETALTFFYDRQSDSASLFRRSHPNSLRGRVWRKLMRQPNKTEDYIIKRLQDNFIRKLQDVFRSMEQSYSVVITTTYSNRILSWLVCGVSPENELWRMIEFIDPSEKEMLEGWSVSALSNQIAYLTSKLRRLDDSGLLNSLLETSVKSGLEYGAHLTGASRRHKLEQTRACVEESVNRKASTVTKNIGFTYYLSTIYVCLGQLSVAFLVLCIEILNSRLNKLKKRRPPLPKPVKRVRRPQPFRPLINQ